MCFVEEINVSGWDVLCVLCGNHCTWNVEGVLQLGNVDIYFLLKNANDCRPCVEIRRSV